MTFNKQSGPRPAKSYLKDASHLAKDGTKDHMAIAMAMRPNGTTQNEVVAVLGKPHRNVIKRLIDLNAIKTYELPDSSRSTRIRLVRRRR